MNEFEQYEVWAMAADGGKRWQLVAAFPEFEVASAVASQRGERVRLVRAVYKDGKVAEQHVIAEVGKVREAS
jgi:hypothetical protein